MLDRRDERVGRAAVLGLGMWDVGCGRGDLVDWMALTCSDGMALLD